MRADRLVGILLMLQRKGQVTAAEVAEEFEVSTRTARRDLDALGAAGLPVYSVQGRGGGWRLLGDGRTDLSGLSAAEVRALFLLAGPTAATTGDVRSALRKLAGALPDPLQTTAHSAAEAMVVDPAPWNREGQQRPDPEFLDDVQTAVVERQELLLDYVARDGTPSSRTVHPLGLAAKGNTWYLVADTDSGLRTFRVDRMVGVEPTGATSRRPEGFDLDDAWSLVMERVQELRLRVTARCDVRADRLGRLRYVFGEQLTVGEATDGGRVRVDVRATGLELLAAQLAGFGADVVVHEPDELRYRLAALGEQLVGLYSS